MALHGVRLFPVFVAVLGLLLPLLASGGTLWPLIALWASLVAAFALTEFRFPDARGPRIVVTIVALPVLFLAGWEGGWWLIPADVAQLALDLRSR